MLRIIVSESILPSLENLTNFGAVSMRNGALWSVMMCDWWAGCYEPQSQSTGITSELMDSAIEVLTSTTEVPKKLRIEAGQTMHNIQNTAFLDPKYRANNFSPLLKILAKKL